MRPPTDRVTTLIRLGLALDCAAVACLPWVSAKVTVYVRLHASLAIIAGLLLIISVLVPKRLPRLAVDPALTLASVVFLGHGFYALFTDSVIGSGGGSRAIHIFLGFGAALVALSQMVASMSGLRIVRPVEVDQ